MQDAPTPSPKATRLVERLTRDQPGFVSRVAVVEVVWGLSASYRLRREQISEALNLLLSGKDLVIDRADLAQQARRAYARGRADFADCLIERIAHAQGCRVTMTFDAGAAKAAGMTLVA